MKTLLRALAFASLFAIVAAPLAAQGITGSWVAEFDRSVRNENGSVTTGNKGKARLVLQQRGDSVTGTFQLVDAPAAQGGRAPSVRPLRGTISGNRVSLESEAEARRSVNGEESVHKVTVVYNLTLDGDTLEGTTTARSANIDVPARPFSARREKP
jgi:hypothetical protein